jgi:hypothetical protein
LARNDYRGIKGFPSFFPNFLPAQRAGKKLGEREKKLPHPLALPGAIDMQASDWLVYGWLNSYYHVSAIFGVYCKKNGGALC